MRLVCITGIDGTGKSTLARALQSEIQRREISTRYVYGRTVPCLSRVIMAAGRFVALRGRSPWKHYESYTAGKQRIMRNQSLAAGYTTAILVDYLVQIWYKLSRSLPGNDIVVCDRYIYDTVISDLAVHLDYSTEDTRRVIAWLMRLVPRPALTILLTAPPEVAFNRKDDVPHIDYLRERHSHYLQIDTDGALIRLDGLLPPDQLVQSAMVEIERRGLLRDRRG